MLPSRMDHSGTEPKIHSRISFVSTPSGLPPELRRREGQGHELRVSRAGGLRLAARLHDDGRRLGRRRDEQRRRHGGGAVAAAAAAGGRGHGRSGGGSPSPPGHGNTRRAQ